MKVVIGVIGRGYGPCERCGYVHKMELIEQDDGRLLTQWRGCGADEEEEDIERSTATTRLEQQIREFEDEIGELVEDLASARAALNAMKAGDSPSDASLQNLLDKFGR